jgi:FdhD protein
VTRKTTVARWQDGQTSRHEDQLSLEEPFAIQLDGKPFATLMRSPGRDEDLTRGFLFSEGIIETPGCIEDIHFEAGEARVTLRPAAKLRVPWARSVQVSSSCGVCGRAIISELIERTPQVEAFDPGPEFFAQRLATVEAAQPDFARTGGSHAAFLYNAAGQLLDSAEDVGRHNALDKLIGAALIQARLPLNQHALLMTSRASFDIVQKAAMAGLPTAAALGAASSLAVELAQAVGLKLYWFVRPNRAVSSAILSS